MKNKQGLVLLVVVLLAAVTRLSWLGTVEFKHDEAYLSLLALDAVAIGEFPVLGMPSSVGIPNAPASVWLMMLPYAITNNPLIATGFVALLNVTGVGVLFMLARRMFNTEVAFITGALYAVNPWAVLYSRKIWAQDMHTPLILLALWFGVLGFIDGRRIFQVLCLPILVFALQMHYAAWLLLPLYILLFVAGRKNISWGAFIMSIVLAALVITPFGIGIWRTWQENPNLITDLQSGDGESINNIAIVILAHASFVTGLGIITEFTDTTTYENSFAVMNSFHLFIGAVLGSGVVVGVAMLFAREIRMTYRTWLILTWVALPVIVFLPGWTEAFPHYFIPSIPALSILIALGMMQISKALLQSTANDKPFSLASPIAVMVVIFQIVLWFQFLQYVNRNPTNFGIPLHHRLEVRSKLQQHDDVLLISDGYRTLLDEEAAAWAVMLHNDACLRVVSGGNFTVIPASPFVVLMEPDSPERDIYMSNGEQAFSHYSLHIHDSMNIDTLPEITSIKFDSGVQVTGMALTGNILQLQWQMPHSQPELNLQYFAHFIDANGERIGQRDGDFLPGRWWCAGDTLITQIDVNAPPKTEIIRIGMYQLTPDGGFINTNVLDENGNPIGTWGDVPFQQQ